MSQVFGINAVLALVRATPERVRAVYVQAGRRDARMADLVAQVRAAGLRLEFVERGWLDSRVEGSHQGVLADCHERALASEAELELRWPSLSRPRLLLILDGITDPRNLGACLRSANAAGVHAVLVPRRNSAPLNAVALKTAAGAAEDLLIVEVANLARRIEWLKGEGVWVFGADGAATMAHHEADLTVDAAIVVGAEGAGMRELTRKRCDHVLAIPMLGSVASLNVSVATGILLFEALRQRGRPPDREVVVTKPSAPAVSATAVPATAAPATAAPATAAPATATSAPTVSGAGAPAADGPVA